jgi:hypothetical protein
VKKSEDKKYALGGGGGGGLAVQWENEGKGGSGMYSRLRPEELLTLQIKKIRSQGNINRPKTLQKTITRIG